MQSFLTKIVVAALLQLIDNPKFQDWAKGLLTGLVGDLETKVDELPARIIGDAEADVKSLLTPVANSSELKPIIDALTSITNLINGFNPFRAIGGPRP